MLRRLRRSELLEYAKQAIFHLGEEEIDEFFTLTEAMFDILDSFDAQPPMFNSRWSVSTSSPLLGNRGIGAQR